MLEIEGEIVAKSYAQAKKMARLSLARTHPGYKIVFLCAEQRDGLRLHSSPVCCYSYFAMLKPKEK